MTELAKIMQKTECPYKEDCLTREGFERKRFESVEEFDLKLCNTHFEECGRYINYDRFLAGLSKLINAIINRGWNEDEVIIDNGNMVHLNLSERQK